MPFYFQTRPSLVVYVTCGDPDLATTREVVLAAIEAGAAVIELGVPFSDPVADGPVIQRASHRALQHGVSLADVLKLAAVGTLRILEHHQAPPGAFATHEHAPVRSMARRTLNGMHHAHSALWTGQTACDTGRGARR